MRGKLLLLSFVTFTITMTFLSHQFVVSAIDVVPSSPLKDMDKEVDVDIDVNLEVSLDDDADTSGGEETFRLLTLNLWNGGSHAPNAMALFAKHIAALRPDIVALQEVYGDGAEKLAAFLNKMEGNSFVGRTAVWSAVSRPCKKYTDTALLTRHKFVEFADEDCTLWGNGASIRLQLGQHKRVLNVFSMHLDYVSYMPDAVRAHPELALEKVLEGEEVRVKNIRQLFANPMFAKWNEQLNSSPTAEQPLLLLGDFNTPSHQDWIEETRKIHNGRSIPWPTTKLLTDNGFVDAFRAVHPNLTEIPGITWPFTWKALAKEEKQKEQKTIIGGDNSDRLDFVFFKQQFTQQQQQPSTMALRPTNAFTYPNNNNSNKTASSFSIGPRKPLLLEQQQWPSDHFALVVDFAFL